MRTCFTSALESDVIDILHLQWPHTERTQLPVSLVVYIHFKQDEAVHCIEHSQRSRPFATACTTSRRRRCLSVPPFLLMPHTIFVSHPADAVPLVSPLLASTSSSQMRAQCLQWLSCNLYRVCSLLYRSLTYEASCCHCARALMLCKRSVAAVPMLMCCPDPLAHQLMCACCHALFKAACAVLHILSSLLMPYEMRCCLAATCCARCPPSLLVRCKRCSAAAQMTCLHTCERTRAHSLPRTIVRPETHILSWPHILLTCCMHMKDLPLIMHRHRNHFALCMLRQELAWTPFARRQKV